MRYLSLNEFVEQNNEQHEDLFDGVRSIILYSDLLTNNDIKTYLN